MNHTPGPWQVVASTDRRSRGYIRRVGSVPGEMAVARVMQGRCFGEQDANARIIAAAPDMLAALELICTNYCPACGCDQKNTKGCNWCATYQIGKAAIRKAKGE